MNMDVFRLDLSRFPAYRKYIFLCEIQATIESL